MPEVIKRIWTIYDLTNELAQIYGARTDNVWRLARPSTPKSWRCGCEGRLHQRRADRFVDLVAVLSIGSSRTEAEMPRLDGPAFNDRFSDWVAVEPQRPRRSRPRSSASSQSS